MIQGLMITERKKQKGSLISNPAVVAENRI